MGRGFLGAGGTEYLPYYFLGEAYFRQNDCANAVVAWENSTKQGVVRTKSEYFGELQKGNAQCEAKGVLLAEKFDAAVTRGRAQLEGANGAMTRVKDKGSANLEVWRSRPAFDAEYQRASNEYDTARKHFNEAQRTRLESDFSEVAKSTERVKDTIDSLDKDLNVAMERGSANITAAAAVRRTIEEARRIDADIEAKKSYLNPALIASRADGIKKLESALEQLEPRRLNEKTVAAASAAAAEGTAFLQKVLETVDLAYAKDNKLRLDRATGLATAAFSRADAELLSLQSLLQGNPGKATPEVQAGAESARKQLESAKRRRDAAIRGLQLAGIEASIRQADAVQQKLIELGTAVGGVRVDPVPAWLREGAKLYFAGDYAGALDRLDDGTAEGPAQLHAHLFRAASQYALYMRSGEKDTARRDQAIADVKRCKAIESTFAPDTRAFSPKFIEFYQRDGAPPQSASRTQ